ncbi:MAG: hypothetical protein Q9219_001341 [cf. Caloplaca sp. 3 TL-2023]
MGDSQRTKTSWKSRVSDWWHQPWYLRGSSDSSSTLRKKASEASSKSRKRRTLSATGISDTQPQSTFLSKVPGEIRNAIYLLVLGDRRLAIYDSGIGPWKRRVRHSEIPSGQIVLPASFPLLPNNKLALLQVCRRIYLEAVGILYTTNQFQMLRVQDMKAFTLFMQSISPTRLASITTLELASNVSYFEPLHPLASNTFKHWKKMLAIICLYMSGLRSLVLYLRNLWAVENLKLTADTYWVKPFLQLRNLEKFELVVHRHDIVAPDHLNIRQPPGDAEELSAKVESLRQHSKKLLCSPA